MKRTITLLQSTCLIALGISLLMILLFECYDNLSGVWTTPDRTMEFYVLMIMELTTLCIIPFALRLFRFKRIAQQLTTPKALKHWGMVRLLMLCIPLVVNTFFYYMYINVAFGYMAIILTLCLAFVFPTKKRCQAELNSLNEK